MRDPATNLLGSPYALPFARTPRTIHLNGAGTLILAILKPRPGSTRPSLETPGPSPSRTSRRLGRPRIAPPAGAAGGFLGMGASAMWRSSGSAELAVLAGHIVSGHAFRQFPTPAVSCALPFFVVFYWNGLVDHAQTESPARPFTPLSGARANARLATFSSASGEGSRAVGSRNRTNTSSDGHCLNLHRSLLIAH